MNKNILSEEVIKGLENDFQIKILNKTIDYLEEIFTNICYQIVNTAVTFSKKDNLLNPFSQQSKMKSSITTTDITSTITCLFLENKLKNHLLQNAISHIKYNKKLYISLEPIEKKVHSFLPKSTSIDIKSIEMIHVIIYSILDELIEVASNIIDDLGFKRRLTKTSIRKAIKDDPDLKTIFKYFL